MTAKNTLVLRRLVDCYVKSWKAFVKEGRMSKRAAPAVSQPVNGFPVSGK